MRCFKVLFCLVLLLASSVAGLSQSADGVTAKVDAIFANFDKTDSPGCALGVIKDGKLIYTRGYGKANLEHGIANGSTLVYDIGSTSKQFAAASILLLAQQGKLSLEDDVRKFIPELPSYQKPILIRHLLHHTSGLRDYLTLFNLAGVNFDDTTTEADALKIIIRQKALNFTPGDEWIYSNSGYFLLSIIIKRASGKSYPEFAQEHIFDPLGMKHTLVLDNHKRIVPMRATGYSPNPKAGFQTEMSNFEQTGDGAVLTSVEDLLKWDQNFYEPKVGGKAFLDQMHAVGAFNDGKKHDYASGLFIEEYKGLRKVSHGGSWAGYRSELLRFPDQKFSVACLCNLGTVNPSALAQRVADMYLADQFTTNESKPSTMRGTPPKLPDPITLTAEQLAEYEGSYYSEELDTTYKLAVENDKLTAMDRNGAKRPLIARTRDLFTLNQGAQFEITRDASGKVIGFGVNAGRIRGVRFVKK
ncbi:MAG: beta-lactamase family protein [Acidobacteria bacterium]|nr:beta-lactamase family protein [Acidobacteriota bacterium]